MLCQALSGFISWPLVHTATWALVLTNALEQNPLIMHGSWKGDHSLLPFDRCGICRRGQFSCLLCRKWLGCLGSKLCHIPDLGAGWNAAWALAFPLGLIV